MIYFSFFKMKNFFIKIKKNKTAIFCLVIFCIFSFLIGSFSFAQSTANPVAVAGKAITEGVGLAVATLLSWIAWAFNMVFGLLLTLLISILVNVAQFSNIIDVEAVKQGWIIVRDLCNMFFILILLIIAFATILRQENYSIKKLLPKLLIMAVLINFSKTIFGLLIDFSQVIMLTFVNGFAQHGAANFISMFQTGDIMKMWGGSAEVNAWSTVVAIIAGVIALIITNIVVLVMLAILVMRIIMLWIYTILSPFVFLGFAFPPIQKYTGQIWEDFTKQLVVGPVLAFFIWLALATASDSSNKLGEGVITKGAEICAGPSVLFCSGPFQTFIITIGLLMGGMMVAQQMGGAAGSIAGKGLAKAQGVLTGAAKLAASPLKGAKMGAGALADYGIDKLHQKTGVDLNLPRAWKGMQAKRAERKADRYSEGMIKAGQVMAEGGAIHGMLAMTGSPGDAWDQITTHKGLRLTGLGKRLKGGRRMAESREKYEKEIKKPESELKTLEEERAGVLSLGEFEEQRKPREGRIKEIDDEIMMKEAEIRKPENFGKTSPIREEIIKLEEEKAEKDKEITDLSGRVDDGKAVSLDSQIENKKGEVGKAKKKYQPMIEKNVPAYTFEARAAEQKAVSEKIGKIKDITDANELLRILQGAIADHDKTMVKAIMKKMTREANDNEFLQPLAGDTGHHGLKKLMNDLSDEKSDNYAGFTKQEAYGLGSEVAEINKGANHWGATSSYLMENGQWRETTDEEHYKIRSIEVGKIEQQRAIRDINRLGYGKEDKERKFHIDAGGLLLLKSFDNQGGYTNIPNRMNESAATNVYGALVDESGKLKPEFVGKISDKLLAAIKARLGNIRGQNFSAQYEQVRDFA